MTRRRSHGAGGVYAQGKNTFRLRYRIKGQRFSETFEGNRADANKRLRALLHSGDTGEHVAPDRITLEAWATYWIEVGAPGRRKRAAGARAVERYDQLLRVHVLPTLGATVLQKLDGTDIDKLYLGLEGKIAPRTARHVHSVLNACLGAAVRTRKLAINPMDSITKTPSPGESDHGVALDDEQLRTLVQGFKGSPLFGIVSVAAFTGARRNEILALRWSDLNEEAKTLRIERAIEETKKHGVRFKGPKKDSHKRTIPIDDDLLSSIIVRAR